jgi:hypothetical protein
MNDNSNFLFEKATLVNCIAAWSTGRFAIAACNQTGSVQELGLSSIEITVNSSKKDNQQITAIRGQDIKLTWDEIDITVEPGRGGVVEHEDDEKFHKEYIKTIKPDIPLTETRTIEDDDKENHGQKVKKEVEYII